MPDAFTTTAAKTTVDTDWLERMYNNRALVPEHAEHFQAWARDSAAAREAGPAQLDVPYGSGAMERLDVFPAMQGKGLAPVMVFIHGGYWRSLDKADHSFVAPAFTQQGVCVVVPNYDLCPAVTVSTIAQQMVQAVAWVWRHIAQYGGDPDRITVVGHSAGGHLATMLLACQWPQVGADLPRKTVKNALSISGLYDLQAMRDTPSLQVALRLTDEEVPRISPARLPAPVGTPLITVAGGNESAEFIRHNGLMQAAWGLGCVPVAEVLPGLNHFSIVEALIQPGHRLNDLAWSLIGATV
jgi:arylformamidase